MAVWHLGLVQACAIPPSISLASLCSVLTVAAFVCPPAASVRLTAPRWASSTRPTWCPGCWLAWLITTSAWDDTLHTRTCSSTVRGDRGGLQYKECRGLPLVGRRAAYAHQANCNRYMTCIAAGMASAPHWPHLRLPALLAGRDLLIVSRAAFAPWARSADAPLNEFYNNHNSNTIAFHR